MIRSERQVLFLKVDNDMDTPPHAIGSGGSRARFYPTNNFVENVVSRLLKLSTYSENNIWARVSLTFAIINRIRVRIFRLGGTPKT